MEIDVHPKVNSIFWTMKEATTRYIFNEGGTRSGKTYSILQLFYALALDSEKPLVFSVVSETMPHLKKGAIRDFYSFLDANSIFFPEDQNKTDSTYKVKNSIIEFFSADSVGKVHGPERDYLFVNEIQNVSYEIFFHLSQRTRIQIFTDWNPTHEFFMHTHYLNDPLYKSDITYIHSTIFDNKFVSEEIKKEVLRRSERDENYKTIYLEGKIGRFEGLIFPNVQLIDEMPETETRLFGLDFGYSHDPAALVEVIIQGENIYLDEIIYQTGLSNKALSLKMDEAGITKRVSKIFADSAEPKSIDDLYLDRWNIVGATKGADSLMWGISLMKEFNIHVTKSSLNLINEFRNYTFAKDKNGKELNVPIDLWNHGIDACRYAISMMQRAKHKENIYYEIPKNMAL